MAPTVTVSNGAINSGGKAFPVPGNYNSGAANGSGPGSWYGGLVAPPQPVAGYGFSPTGPQGPAGPQGYGTTVTPEGGGGNGGYLGHSPQDWANLIAQHQQTLVPPDPTQIGATATNEAAIHALYDTLAGHINDAYNAHVGNLNSEYGSGVAGVNQAGTQAHQQMGLYGQQEQGATRAGNKAVTQDWNRVIGGGNQQVADPMMSALQAYTGGRGGQNVKGQGANLAGYIGDLGASRAASQAFAQQLGQIAGVDNSNAQQVASGIQQGGLTDLHSVLNSGLSQAAIQRDTGLNNAALEQAKLQIAANSARSGSSGNSLQDWLFKQQYMAAHPGIAQALDRAKLGTMSQRPGFSIPTSAFSPGMSGTPLIPQGDVAGAQQFQKDVNSGVDPGTAYSKYLSTSKGKPNAAVTQLFQDWVGSKYTPWQNLYGNG
jgi:hypothetical protein